MRGLGTAGPYIRRERGHWSRVERGREYRWCPWLFIARMWIVPHAACRVDADPHGQLEAMPGCYWGIVASDQHQPAISRATATLAITGRLFRAV